MEVRTRQIRILICVINALFASAGPVLPQAHAQSTTTADDPRWWWFHGEVEAGGRFFLNNPEKNGVASLQQDSLAKFYEYSANKPGPFGNVHLATGSHDGLYEVDVSGKNIGYDDQRFDVSASKAGEQYFNFGWDQTPHKYGTGWTIYNGVGSNALTLPGGLSNSLFGAAGCTNVPGAVPRGAGCGTLTAAQATAVQSLINRNVHQTDIGIRRDTASADYRWTPADAWDIRVDYSHMHRWGTQVDGVVFTSNTSGVVSQVPKPVDDTTQNFGINGEYAGASSWGKYNFKLAYAGSVYQDANDSYTVENPFCATGSGPGECARTAQPSSPTALMSLWPSNQSNGFTATLGADLPAKSRYMGTVSYVMMRQNEAFLPFTNNALVYTNGAQTVLGAPPGLPASSLNGAINTLLSNNVLTTQLTPELKSKLSYRYYNYQNDTPEIRFNDWVLADMQTASSRTAAYAPVTSISPAYTRQNAGAELSWNPNREWNLGAAYGFERYNWSRADANITNEHSGKGYADWKPTSWITARSSWLSSLRRYDSYDYFSYVGNAQWPTLGATHYSYTMRQFYLNNRERNKGQASVAIDVMRGVTVTPTVGYQDDAYTISDTNVGLTSSQAWRSGVDLAYTPDPGLRFLLSYMYEERNQHLKATTATALTGLTAANTYRTTITDRVNTYIAMVDYAAIPQKLDLKLSYTYSYAKDSQPVRFDSGGQPSTGQYPDTSSVWQRLEATAKYTFDKETVRQLGWTGEVAAKLRYAWERNSVVNYANDLMSSYMWGTNTGYGYMTWLAYNNPNYDVHLIGASLTFKW